MKATSNKISFWHHGYNKKHTEVSYSLTDADTFARESGALTKLPNIHPCRRRVIITYDEESTITDKYGTIEVIPCWKWMLINNSKP